MKIFKTIKPLTHEIDRVKRKPNTIGFIPTMGFLHEGHLSLVRQARRDTDCVVVSIFVNPTQFCPEEDFKKYPRDLKMDLEICKKNKVDIIFVPSVRSIYSGDFSTYVNVEGLTDTLCGRSRPGHFKGVTTIVAKLFNIVRPDIAYFGQKDAQQAIVIRTMVRELNMPLKIKILPIIREKDGLAMSSRNVYLSPKEREEALSIDKSLQLAKSLYRKGEMDSKKIINEIKGLITKERDTKIDYVSIVDFDTLKDIDRITRKSLVAVAVKIGRTRLIDNVILSKGE